jgi:glycosyltransferase involved in cell wall biosynthesis
VASVDVAIPSYQYGHFLRECVNSVLDQEIDDLRILIIDNASTDDSVEIARELAARDPRIEVIARPVNLGAQTSFNEAVDWAKADYFTILCADDRLAPGALKRAVTVMEEHPSVSFTYGRGIQLRPSGGSAGLPDEPLGGQHDWTIINGPDFIARRCHTGTNHIATCTVLVRTTCQKQVGHYREGMPYTDDLEMWMRLATLGPVAETNATQGIWLVHGANMSAYYQARQTRDLLAIKDAFDSFFRHEGSQMPNAQQLHRQAVRSIGERSYWSALSHLSRGHGSTGLALFKLAVRLRPSTAIVPPVNYLFRMDDPIGRVKQVASEIRGNLATLRPAKHG